MVTAESNISWCVTSKAAGVDDGSDSDIGENAGKGERAGSDADIVGLTTMLNRGEGWLRY
jgi:hypothetical protein